MMRRLLRAPVVPGLGISGSPSGAQPGSQNDSGVAIPVLMLTVAPSLHGVPRLGPDGTDPPVAISEEGRGSISAPPDGEPVDVTAISTAMGLLTEGWSAPGAGGSPPGVDVPARTNYRGAPVVTGWGS